MRFERGAVHSHHDNVLELASASRSEHNTVEIEEHIPLHDFTTFHLGGFARFFVRVHSVEELNEAIAFAQSKNLPTLILGGGSNMLVDDKGFDGVVIKVELKGIERDGNTIIAAAGESWDGLVAHAVEQGLWGIENLSGIPGTVGAAPVQNIGAYGTEVKDALAWLEARTPTGEIVRLTPAECGFGYRTSRFKQEGGWIIVRVGFALAPNGAPNTTYKDLKDAGTLSLSDIRSKIIAIRAGKFPDITQEGTAGSFFLNPTVSLSVASTLAERYPALPQFIVEGGVKLSLAWLLDNALSLKGERVGGARLYEKQPLVIVADANATAHDVRELAKIVKEKVQSNLDINLEEEVRIIL